MTAQFTNSVMLIPRQYRPTPDSARKSILTSIGMIISHTSTATGRFTLAISAAPIAWNTGGNIWPSKMPATMHAATHRVR